MILFVIILLFVLWQLPSFWRFVRIHRKAASLPGPSGLPIIGSIFELKEGSHVGLRWMMREAQKLREKGHSIICFNIAARIYTIPITASAAKVLVESHEITGKGRDYEFIKPWLGEGLLTASGDRWRLHRKIITPTFHFARLNNYIPAFVAEAEVFVSIVGGLLEVEIDAYPLLKKCTLDIICSTTFGDSFNMQKHPNHPYVHAVEGYNSYVQRYSSEIHMWIGPIWYALHERKVRSLLKELKAFTEEKIEQRIRYRQNVDKGGSSFADCLLAYYEAGELTLDEVKDEINTFVFAGHDTTSTTMGWLFWCLATNEHVQEKLHAELDEIMSDGHEGIDEKIKDMPYFDQCIKEAMRLYATAPFTERIVDKDFDLDGYSIPAGSEVFLSPMLLHHNPDVYANDWEFDPDRFSPENTSARNHYDYLPFSGGPRNCIGQKFALMEIKVVSAIILHSFRLSSNYEMTYNVPAPEVILRPMKGIPIKFHARS
ncbi:hypothetical protein PMAYCL1PPCAC_30405 [Pristionchus mayeri]|uniref:Cytochrome P450 n=1 Tax=Pristionchus mayeri TaxID=1317129 RepID=A0AAN5IDN1_9BILA|nr:hypothetical protein PMAYCL1PPCAC_30405 [Pristionchus mayeri]